MTEEIAVLEPVPWWEETPAGRTIALAFVKIDRAASTREWTELPPDQVDRRHLRYAGGVESVARGTKAAQPLHWQGDGVMLFITDGEDGPAPVRGFRAARLLWERMTVDLGMPARIAVHAAHVPWCPDTGKLRHPAIDRCGHLEHVAPENAIAVSEDVYLALPEDERRALAPLGFTARDGTPVWVFPAAAAERKRADAFRESDDLRLWERFRQYARGSEIRTLRYVGFPLAKKEPPALEIEDVFVPLEVQVRRRRPAPASELAAKGAKPGTEPARMEDDAGLGAVPFAREAIEEPGPPEPFTSIFREKRGIVILGDPGSGKTTLLRWLAFVAAGGPFAMSRELGVAERILPLPVSVGGLADVRRDLEPSCSVTDALARYFHGRNVGEEGELRAFLIKSLEAGECLVLLDGLDEVRSSERDEIRAWLETFGARYSRNRFIVTSRHVGFAGFGVADGVVATLHPFTDAQVRRYVEAFTRAYRRWEMKWPDPSAEVREAIQLLDAIEQNPRLAALARNPFMLSALALINRAEGRLPRHRVQFYAIFARDLCETWGHARRIVAKAPERVVAFEEEAIPILGELARAMHETFPSGVAPQEFVLGTLARALVDRRGIAAADANGVGREFLKRAGEETQILLERGAGRWGFLHLTFQEFFAAAGLHAAEQFEVEALRHLFDPRWEEVLRLGVGYLALVQNRPEAGRRFVDRVFRHRETGIREPLNVLPRKHEPLAALLAAEAGDTLPRDLQLEVAQRFARWVLDMPGEISHRIEAEIGLTDFRELVVPVLLDALREDQGWVRARAAQALGAMRAEAAGPALVEALMDEAPFVRAGAAQALGALRAEGAVPALLEALKGKNDLVRTRAAEALGALRAEGAVPALVVALNDKEWRVRAGAAEALGALRAEGAVPALVAALADEFRIVRDRAAQALGTLQTEGAAAALLETLKDQDNDVRAEAAAALGALRAEAAVPALLEALKDQHEWVRANAAQALGILRAEVALPALLEALKDQDRSVRAAAAWGLGILRAEVALPALLEALKDQDRSVRGLAAWALGYLRAEVALPALLEALKDQDRSVRLPTAWGLGTLRTKAALPALLEALKDQDGSVRAAAAQALGALRGEAAAPALLEALKDIDSLVRTQAAWGLGVLRAETAIDALVQHANRLKGDDPERVAAIKSLLQIAESPGAAAGDSRARSSD
jgi:HEAT repeat protein